MTRGPWLALLLVLAGCERCERASTHAPGASATPLRGSSVAVTAGGVPALELDVYHASLTLVGEGARLVIHARPRGDAYLASLGLDVTLNSARRGELAPMLEASRCVVRYLERDLLSEADLGVWTLTGELGAAADDGSTRVELHATCRKRFAKTVRGTPHAEPIPNELRVDAVVQARPPVTP